jgi:uncharacterized membrane protein (DUF485 family)
MANDRREPSRSPTTGRMPLEEAVTATEAVGKDPEMVELEHRHQRFVWPVTIFFLVYYLSLPILAGVAPDLFALSQFLMAFVVAWLYARWAANRMDPLATDLREKLRRREIKEVDG